MTKIRLNCLLNFYRINISLLLEVEVILVNKKRVMSVLIEGRRVC